MTSTERKVPSFSFRNQFLGYILIITSYRHFCNRPFFQLTRSLLLLQIFLILSFLCIYEIFLIQIFLNLSFLCVYENFLIQIFLILYFLCIYEILLINYFYNLFFFNGLNGINTTNISWQYFVFLFETCILLRTCPLVFSCSLWTLRE